MLDAPKPLLFGGGDKDAVAHDAGGRIGVVGIDAEDQ